MSYWLLVLHLVGHAVYGFLYDTNVVFSVTAAILVAQKNAKKNNSRPELRLAAKKPTLSKFFMSTAVSERECAIRWSDRLLWNHTDNAGLQTRRTCCSLVWICLTKYKRVYILMCLIYGSFKENPFLWCYLCWCKACKHFPSIWSVLLVFPGQLGYQLAVSLISSTQHGWRYDTVSNLMVTWSSSECW